MPPREVFDGGPESTPRRSRRVRARRNDRSAPLVQLAMAFPKITEPRQKNIEAAATFFPRLGQWPYLVAHNTARFRRDATANAPRRRPKNRSSPRDRRAREPSANPRPHGPSQPSARAGGKLQSASSPQVKYPGIGDSMARKPLADLTEDEFLADLVRARYPRCSFTLNPRRTRRAPCPPALFQYSSGDADCPPYELKIMRLHPPCRYPSCRPKAGSSSRPRDAVRIPQITPECRSPEFSHPGHARDPTSPPASCTQNPLKTPTRPGETCRPVNDAKSSRRRRA